MKFKELNIDDYFYWFDGVLSYACKKIESVMDVAETENGREFCNWNAIFLEDAVFCQLNDNIEVEPIDKADYYNLERYHG